MDRSWQCAYASGWRVFVLGTGAAPPWLVDPIVGPEGWATPPADPTPGAGSGGLEATRAWLAVDPITGAEGPTDPRIPIVEVIVRAPPGMGYCAPADDPGERPPADTTVSAWALSPDGQARSLDLRSIGQSGAPDASSEGLYAPAADAPTWPPGRYVFRLLGADGYERWFGAEILLPAAGPRGGLGPPPIASPSAAP